MASEFVHFERLRCSPRPVVSAIVCFVLSFSWLLNLSAGRRVAMPLVAAPVGWVGCNALGCHWSASHVKHCSMRPMQCSLGGPHKFPQLYNMFCKENKTLHNLYTNFTQTAHKLHTTLQNPTKLYKALRKLYTTLQHYTNFFRYNCLQNFTKLYKAVHKFLHFKQIYKTLQTFTKLTKLQTTFIALYTTLTKKTQQIYTNLHRILQSFTTLHTTIQKLYTTIHNPTQLYISLHLIFF